MVNWSVPLLAATVTVIVRVVELFTAIEAAVMSRPAKNVMLGVAAVLNSKPAGGFSTRVTAVPGSKSNLFPSSITMGPRVVQAGEVALAALSAEMLSPPLAGVIETAARAVEQRLRPTARNAKTTKNGEQARARQSASRAVDLKRVRQDSKLRGLLII
jgi:hypothetical protein